MKLHKLPLSVIAAAAMLSAGPAMAQKAKDTLRVGFYQPISIVDLIENPQPEVTLMASAVFESLIRFDADSRTFKPELAKSWTRVNDTTLEFKLRDDIKFQDGSAFDADDVVYTVNYAIDPKNNFRFKFPRYGWIDHVEKVDQYTVRIVGKQKFAADIERDAENLPIYPSDYHAAMVAKSKDAFGKAPIGTGPYRVLSVDSTKGVVMERFDGFVAAGKSNPAAKIKRVEIAPIPDRQTQAARMLTGEQDLMYDVEKDQADEMAEQPNMTLTVFPSVNFSYMYFDSADKSGIHVFKDKRVREALAHAVNREAMNKALQPKAAANEPLPMGMCNRWHIACDFTAKPMDYDPAKAKALLAEAGLKDGFDLQITSWGRTKDIAEAVAGELRKIGVRAKVNYLTFGAYNKIRDEGKVQMFVSYWDNGGAQADVHTTAAFFYAPGTRNYTGDKSLTGLMAKGVSVFGEDERKAIYRQLFNKVNEEVYLFPLIALPSVMIHSKDLVIEGDQKSPEGFKFNRLHWQ